MITWEELKANISAFFDTKIVIILTTILSIALVVLLILSKTSIGKRALAKLISLYDIATLTCRQTEEKVKEVEKLANEKIESLKVEYDNKVTALVSIVNYYEESLFQIIEKIPNAKVQRELTILKDTYLDKKKEINQWVTLTYQDKEKEVQELVAKVEEEKDLKIATLQGEINELKDLYNSLIKTTEVKQNGEKTEDTDTTKEEI